MKILIFTEGTILKPSSPDKAHDYKSYVAIGKAVEKVNGFVEQGAEVSFLTSRDKFLEIKAIQDVLKTAGFIPIKLHARREGEDYLSVVKAVMPDILIEDNCASLIEKEIISEKFPKQDLMIKAIVVNEFEGIDSLPDNIDQLPTFGEKIELPKDSEE